MNIPPLLSGGKGVDLQVANDAFKREKMKEEAKYLFLFVVFSRLFVLFT